MIWHASSKCPNTFPSLPHRLSMAKNTFHSFRLWLILWRRSIARFVLPFLSLLIISIFDHTKTTRFTGDSFHEGISSRLLDQSLQTSIVDYAQSKDNPLFCDLRHFICYFAYLNVCHPSKHDWPASMSSNLENHIRLSCHKNELQGIVPTSSQLFSGWIFEVRALTCALSKHFDLLHFCKNQANF